MAGELEWPFKADDLGLGRSRFRSATAGEDRVWSYNPPSPMWETLNLSDADTEHPLSADDTAGLGRVMGALDTHGACLLRGDGAAAAACAELKLALAAEATNGGTVKGVAQRFAESWPLVAHPTHMKLCAGALGRQLLRIASLGELGARMSLPSTFTGGASFKQFPFELDYARASATQQPTKLTRPYLGAAFVPVTHDLENQLTCFWALDRAIVLRFVPGSHRWPLGRDADESAAVEVVLQPGDSLVCASGLWRGAGAGAGNSLVLEVGYHLAFWQTEEENQMAIGSPQAALLLPPHIARLCGWCKPGDVLNKQYSGGLRADPLGAAGTISSEMRASDTYVNLSHAWYKLLDVGRSAPRRPPSRLGWARMDSCHSQCDARDAASRRRQLVRPTGVSRQHPMGGVSEPSRAAGAAAIAHGPACTDQVRASTS